MCSRKSVSYPNASGLRGVDVQITESHRKLYYSVRFCGCVKTTYIFVQFVSGYYSIQITDPILYILSLARKFFNFQIHINHTFNNLKVSLCMFGLLFRIVLLVSMVMLH